MKVHYGTGKQKDYDYNARKKAQSDEIDRILDKLKKSGLVLIPVVKIING